MKKIYACLFLATLILASLAGEACQGLVPPPPVNHNGPLPSGTDADCALACENLRSHKCAAGDPTPDGAPCEVVCQNVESSGYASQNPRCEAKAASCDEADACSDEASP